MTKARDLANLATTATTVPTTTDGSYSVTTITAGTGNVSWT